MTTNPSDSQPPQGEQGDSKSPLTGAQALNNQVDNRCPEQTKEER